jgi:acyl-CoA thioesterase I
MHSARLLCRPALVLAALASIAAVPARGEGATFAPVLALPCAIPSELARFEHPLRRTAQRLSAQEPVKIVAIGSSSTFGEGASAPERSYPSRLRIELTQRFMDRRFVVVNRGVNGDTDHDKRARFERDVIAEKPDMVLWQLGTNSMLGGDPMETHLPILQDGVAHLRKATGADIVLVDPQYAPKVLRGGAERASLIVDLIAQTAQGSGVNLFRRFELMRHWREEKQLSFDKFLSEDEFHMNDWSYSCVARAMGDAIAEAATRPARPAPPPSAAR